jgi:hypothetical protein
LSIKARFAELDAEHRDNRAATIEKQRKIDRGELLDVDHEPILDHYLGDTVENLTDAKLRPWQTYGAKHRSSNRKGSAKSKRGRPFCTKESRPRGKTVTARVTNLTIDRLRGLKAEFGRNPADLLTILADLYAAAQDGNHAAKLVLKIAMTYGRRLDAVEVYADTRQLLSVAIKGLPPEAA